MTSPGPKTATQTGRGERRGAGLRRCRCLTQVHPLSVEALAAGGGPSWMLDDTAEVTLGRGPSDVTIVVADSEVSRFHAVIAPVRDLGVLRVRDLGSKNGIEVNGSRVLEEVLNPNAVLRLGGTFFVYSELALPERLPPPVPAPGTSLARAHLERLADLAAPASLPVLIQGPTGSGKERLAQRVHDQSGRVGRLVPVNCATLSPELHGSELFGHARGAFTGAAGAHDGLFVAADRGTLFLDEVAELPPVVQAGLLRALQERAVRPVGGHSERRVDVRIVAATHRSLAELQGEATGFRADLFGRLAGLTLEVPALAERREEIVPLFLRGLAEEPDTNPALPVPAPEIDADAVEALLLHDWPRNVRELLLAAAAARLFLPAAGRIELALLPAAVQSAVRQKAEEARARPSREVLVELLRQHRGNVSGVTRALDQHRTQVNRWLQLYALDPKRFRAP